MLKPEVQIYIPVYNDIRYFPIALNSALSQTGVDIEVIVSDNASTDGTFEFVERMARENKAIRLHRNATTSTAFENIGLVWRYVDAPFYMVLCSDDVILTKDAISKAMACMAANPEIVSVYCDLRYIDGEGRRLLDNRFHREGLFDARDTLRASIIRSRNGFGIPLLHRSSAAKKVNYPTGLPYAGDLYHSAKVAEYGQVYHIPELLIGNRYTGKNLTADLYRNSANEFRSLQEEFGIVLSPGRRLHRNVNAFVVRFFKTAFLFWARLRSPQRWSA